jgi:bifunctional non-homologous end joining protein LigD
MANCPYKQVRAKDKPAPAILVSMLPFQPMPLQRRKDAFDHPEWIFELKYDGFRAMAVIEPGRAQLISRNGHQFASFADLGQAIASDLAIERRCVLDGEIVCVDRKGKPQFKNLLFRRGDPCFFAFDLLMLNGKDQRPERLSDRKQELRRLLANVPAHSVLKYVDHIDGSGTSFFERVCRLDLEGIVAKHKHAPYVSDREHTTWFKILNRAYSQKAGREELFERDRHKEPVAGWHSCVIACAESEAN